MYLFKTARNILFLTTMVFLAGLPSVFSLNGMDNRSFTPTETETLQSLMRDGNLDGLEKKLIELSMQRSTTLKDIVNYRLGGDKQDSLLHYACSYSKSNALIKFFINNKANVNAEDADGSTPLYYTRTNESLAGVEDLFAAGADIYHINKKGETPLLAATKSGNSNLAKLLITKAFTKFSKKYNRYECRKYFKKWINHPNQDGDQPLHYAAAFDNHMVQLLISAGATLNATNNQKKTPLYYAINQPTIVRTLLNAGANIYSEDERKETPLHVFIKYASAPNEEECTELLIEKAKKDNKAHEYVNKQNIDGQTPLHLAAHFGRYKIAKSLLAAGANINQQDHKKKTPLHVAVEKRSTHPLFIAYLVTTAQASTTITDLDGKTPKDLAFAKKRDYAVIDQFLPPNKTFNLHILIDFFNEVEGQNTAFTDTLSSQLYKYTAPWLIFGKHLLTNRSTGFVFDRYIVFYFVYKKKLEGFLVIPIIYAEYFLEKDIRSFDLTSREKIKEIMNGIGFALPSENFTIKAITDRKAMDETAMSKVNPNFSLLRLPSDIGFYGLRRGLELASYVLRSDRIASYALELKRNRIQRLLQAELSRLVPELCELLLNKQQCVFLGGHGMACKKIKTGSIAGLLVNDALTLLRVLQQKNVRCVLGQTCQISGRNLCEIQRTLKDQHTQASNRMIFIAGSTAEVISYGSPVSPEKFFDISKEYLRTESTNQMHSSNDVYKYFSEKIADQIEVDRHLNHNSHLTTIPQILIQDKDSKVYSCAASIDKNSDQLCEYKPFAKSQYAAQTKNNETTSFVVTDELALILNTSNIDIPIKFVGKIPLFFAGIMVHTFFFQKVEIPHGNFTTFMSDAIRGPGIFTKTPQENIFFIKELVLKEPTIITIDNHDKPCTTLYDVFIIRGGVAGEFYSAQFKINANATDIYKCNIQLADTMKITFCRETVAETADGDG